jgi:hypothetical protein
MSILPIKTNFFGVNRPSKASFSTCGPVTVNYQERVQVANTNIPESTVANPSVRVGAPVVGGDMFNLVTPLPPNTLQDNQIVRISGNYVGLTAQITGYIPGQNNYYFIIETDGTQNFVLGPVNGFPLTDVTPVTFVPGEPGGVGHPAIGDPFGNLTFTVFNYTPVPTITPLLLNYGTTIVDVLLNRLDGSAFPNGCQITVAAGQLTSLSSLILFYRVNAVGQVSIIPGPGFGITLQDTAQISLTRSDVQEPQPPLTNVRVTVEKWSESQPSQN